MTAGEVLAFPTRAPLEPDNVPLELRERPQWVRFKWEPPNVKGKRSKVPWHPTENRGASSTDPATWGTFADAVSHVGQHGTAGIGYVFCKADGYARGKGEDDAAFSARLARLAEHADNYTAIDFDACLTDSGYLTPTVAEWVGRLDSYAEVSISGTGLHIIARGGIPDGRGRKRDGIEVYDRGRYFTFTGDLLDGEPRQVRDANGALTELLALLDKPAPSSANEPAAVTGSAELPPSTLSRHERLLARSVILARAGEPEPSIYAALRAWRDLLGGEPGDRVIPDAELRNLARSAVAKFAQRAGANAEDREPAEPYATFSLGECRTAKRPERELLFPGFDLRRRNLIVAPSGTGKTWFVLEVALKAAAGKPLFGEFPPRRAYRVLLVAEEDYREDLQVRLKCLAEGSGITPDDLADRLQIVCGEGFWFGDDVARARLTATVQAFRPELILFDSIGEVANIPNGDKAEDVQAFYRTNMAPLHATGAGLSFTHHTNKLAYQKQQPADDAALIHGSDRYRRISDSTIFLRPAPKARGIPSGGAGFVVSVDKQRIGRRRGSGKFLVAIYPDQNAVRANLPDEDTPLSLVYLGELSANEAAQAIARPGAVDKIRDVVLGTDADLTYEQLGQSTGYGERTIRAAVKKLGEEVEVRHGGHGAGDKAVVRKRGAR